MIGSEVGRQSSEIDIIYIQIKKLLF